MENQRTQMKINLKKSGFNASNQSNGLGCRNGATSPFFVRKACNTSSNSSHDGKSSHSGSAGSPPTAKKFGSFKPRSKLNQQFNQMSINDLKSEKFSHPNSIVKERFFGSVNYNNHNNYNNYSNNRVVIKPNANNRLAQADLQDAQKIKIQQQQQAAALAAKQEIENKNKQDEAALTLQQIQEAKPGNKRAILTDLPEYLYSIPALASFFEPYGEVAMLQILPLQRMWDGDLIDLLGASMCNRLAQGTYCAIVEFYSARMAKFIIGILRKRLPVLKFRCALLKPSAAIELTNQADNLGLTNAVKLRHIPAQNKDEKKLSDSENGSSSGCGVSNVIESDSDHSMQKVVVGPVETPVVSSEESGMDELSSSNHQTESNVSSSSSCNESESENAQNSNASETATNGNNGERFVTSFKIQLNR